MFYLAGWTMGDVLQGMSDDGQLGAVSSLTAPEPEEVDHCAFSHITRL